MHVDLTCFTGEINPNTLIDLYKPNFAPGKLPLNKVHKGDFPSLKPNFIPKLHIETLQTHLNI